jgi:hypothetical protein
MFTRDGGLVIGRVVYPPWTLHAAAAGAFVVLMTLLAIVLPHQNSQRPTINVAFIGNSMQYYNDLPRLVETLANGKMHQNSCLHGGASLTTILIWGNGMGTKWKTGTARIGRDIYNTNNSETTGSSTDAVYDFGACTVPQLLFGYDEALNEKVSDFHAEKYKNDDQVTDDGSMSNLYNEDADDYYSYYDGSNPCLLNENYLPYLQDVYYNNNKNNNNNNNDDSTGDDDENSSSSSSSSSNIQSSSRTKFDFVVMNDNTRSPARNDTREEGLQVLASTYIPWFLEMSKRNGGHNTIPVFIRYVE